MGFFVEHFLLCFAVTALFGWKIGMAVGLTIEATQAEAYWRAHGKSLRGYGWRDTLADLGADALGIGLAVFLFAATGCEKQPVQYRTVEKTVFVNPSGQVDPRIVWGLGCEAYMYDWERVLARGLGYATNTCDSTLALDWHPQIVFYYDPTKIAETTDLVLDCWFYSEVGDTVRRRAILPRETLWISSAWGLTRGNYWGWRIIHDGVGPPNAGPLRRGGVVIAGGGDGQY